MSEDQGASPDALAGDLVSEIAAAPSPEPQPVEMPAAPAAEVSAPPKPPKRKKFRYVVRAALPHFHIYEESTGVRITQHPMPSEAQAQDLAERWTEQQTPPR